MRTALISDIHGNLEALETILEDINRRGVDETICLGDIVGYGPNPIECIDLVAERCVGRGRGRRPRRAVDRRRPVFGRVPEADRPVAVELELGEERRARAAGVAELPKGLVVLVEDEAERAAEPRLVDDAGHRRVPERVLLRSPQRAPGRR